MPRKSLSARRRFEVLQTHNFACFYCGLPSAVAALEVDHVVPVAIGGTNDPWNLVPACQPCNAGKGAHAPTQEMVAAARGAFMAGRSGGYVQCTVCGVPFATHPDDVHGGSPQCQPCNEAICEAFDTGVDYAKCRWGLPQDA